MVKQLLILIAFSFACHGQTKNTNVFQDISYKDITEIKGLIYKKADTSLVTGRVIRYNRKKEAKRYVFVTQGKPDVRGWIQINESFERPKESVLGEVVKGTAVITGAVMAVSGNDVNLPYQGKTNEFTGNALKTFQIVQKDYIKNAYDEMSRRSDISNNQTAIDKERSESYEADSKDIKLDIEENLVEETRGGKWETFYKSGTLRSIGWYVKGKKEGKWQEYYENGHLEMEVEFAQGKKTGLLKRYHSNGELLGRINYKNGKEEGLIEAYYKNGQLLMKGQFQDGKQIGEWKYYNENGDLIEIKNYDD